jgi:hypothetical protein
MLVYPAAMTTGLGFLALVFALIAAYFLYVGFSISTAVSAGDGTFTANLQLMQVQSLDIMVGLAAAIVASIFTVGTCVAAIIEPNSRG